MNTRFVKPPVPCILGSLGVSTYSLAIHAAQNALGLPWQAVTHVGVVGAPVPVVLEALSDRGVVHRPFSEMERDHPYLLVPFKDPDFGMRLWQAASKYVGLGYDAKAAFRSPILDRMEQIRPGARERMFCSEVLAWARREIDRGYTFNPEAILPAHVMAWDVLDPSGTVLLPPL